ncbi:gliding motility-associated C-terminal domain-containing protein [Carboxylicivirga sp. N1Y90]|uniref:T9SS type B sorting domain-containing protein n=1 Tax=Carboxylicivirga fragile TaxID=3417571 RepID=UPI003D343D82|nr:gliding motility-associated C-terminal domain-containing protein [Marinilabiliaceae bacterium N1Y90]
MKPIHKILVLVLISLLSSGINAQISAPDRFYEELTSYPDGNNDPIFYFEDINSARLIAPTGATYQWFRYSNTSNSFEPLVGENGNTLNSVGEYGYRVQVDNGVGTISDYYCWAFVPMITDASINIELANCNNLRQLASTNFKNLVYFNHKGDNSSIAVDYEFVYNWSSIPVGPIEGIGTQSIEIDAPTEDTEYHISISNKFTPTIEAVEATNDYIAIAVSADFVAISNDPEDNEIKEASAAIDLKLYADVNPDTKEVLSRGHISEYKFTDDDVLIDYAAQIQSHIIKDLGENVILLEVVNLDSGCESVSAPQTFTIKEMVVKVPGAFSPFSSPNQNDEFKVLYRSVAKFNMLIYNRWGRMVYKGTNPAEGWDGRINGRKAEPGVYFYMIEAEGYNKDERTKLEGAVHLIIN